MKKTFTVILAALMVFACTVPVTAARQADPATNGYAEYDRAYVASDKDGYIDSLDDNQLAGIILDRLDREIAAVTADFASFNTTCEITVMDTTVEIPVEIPLEIKGIDDLIGYKDYLTKLGGDFANLDTALLNKTRADGDLNFIYSVIEFIAANSDIFGKVFAWEEGQTFDFGAVGEYIETLDAENEIRVFYEDYLKGNNIQEKFISEIAREMGYTVGDGEDFDTVINNGIRNLAADFLQETGLLSDEGAKTLKLDSDFDLRTENVYALLKNLTQLIENDNEAKFDAYLRYFLDTPVRMALKASFGETPVEGEAVTVPASFASVYTDLDLLKEISGGKLYYKDDENYYAITIGTDNALSAKSLTWTESLLNFDPPTVEICDTETKVGGPYTPTSMNVADYAPTVYTADYSEYIDTTDLVSGAAEFGVKVTADEIPEDITAIISAGDGVEMKDAFVLKINGDVPGFTGIALPENITITFEEIEALANKTIADSLPSLQATVDSVVDAAVSTANTLPIIGGSITGSVTLNSVSVKLAYTGYSDEDTFVCEVSAVPVLDITYGGNVWDYASMIGFTKEKIEADYIQPVIEAAVTNPVATIVVDHLNGTADGLDDVTALMEFFDSDFDVDTSILDFAENWDAFNGVFGQANRVLCDTLEMLLADSGYSSLGLTEGSNDNLDDNIQKLCAKADSIISLAKEYMSAADFKAFADEMNINSAFASEHGFNANMIYEMDFSDPENMFVCLIRLGCDFIVEDNSGILYDIHLIVEDMDTLEQMAVGIFDYAMPALAEKAAELIDGFSYTYTPVNTGIASNEDAKDYIMNALVDFAFAGIDFAEGDIVNLIANKVVDAFNNAAGTAFPHVRFVSGVKKGETWEESLANIAARAVEIIDGLWLNADAAKTGTGLEKIGKLLEIIPFDAIISNYDGLTNIVNAIFSDALDGRLESTLKYAETQEDTVFSDVPVTKALINASDAIVSEFFPTTVSSDDYAAGLTVQQEFTSSANDILIASRNMKDINANKVQLVSCGLNLIREAGTLYPFFAACDTHDFGEGEVIEATCLTAGSVRYTCSNCGYVTTEAGEAALGHEYSVIVKTVSATCTQGGYTTYKCVRCDATENRNVTAKKDHSYIKTVIAPTCTENGYSVYKCADCGTSYTGDETAALGHDYVDGKCTRCDSEQKVSFLQKIINFFKRIVDWFKNLF